jgi:hypothetical protein
MMAATIERVYTSRRVWQTLCKGGLRLARLSDVQRRFKADVFDILTYLDTMSQSFPPIDGSVEDDGGGIPIVTPAAPDAGDRDTPHSRRRSDVSAGRYADGWERGRTGDDADNNNGNVDTDGDGDRDGVGARIPSRMRLRGASSGDEQAAGRHFRLKRPPHRMPGGCDLLRDSLRLQFRDQHPEQFTDPNDYDNQITI